MVCASEGEIPTVTHLNLITAMSFQVSKASKKANKINKLIKTQAKDNDTPQTEADSDNIIDGTDGDDYIIGTDGDDVIVAGTGNDTIYGGGGNDTIYGGEGDDFIVLNPDGQDSVDGGSGEDTITLREDDTTISGGEGDDRIYIEPTESSDEAEDPSQDAPQGAGKQRAFDPIIKGGRFFGVEKMQRIDHWNFDAVNWFSKEDALAALKGLESQLISLDDAGLSMNPFKSPLFGFNSNALFGAGTNDPMAT